MHLQRNTTLLFNHFYHSQWFDTFYNVQCIFNCANYLCIFQYFSIVWTMFLSVSCFPVDFCCFVCLLLHFQLFLAFTLHFFSIFECFSSKKCLCFSTINRNLFHLKNVSYHFWHGISIFGHLHSWHFVQLIWKMFTKRNSDNKKIEIRI